MKTVVILGGSGFVGRRLSPALAATGYRVYSVSRSPVVQRDPRVEYIDCNYDNVYQLGELYQRADVIFHLAWDTTPATSSRQSSLEVTANLLPSLRLLEYLEHYGKGQLVYASSGGTIYGDSGEQARDEGQVVAPIAHYGAGKGSIELFLQAYHRQAGKPVTILRPSNIYGPGQLPKQHFGVVPTLLDAIRSGATFSLMGDGESRRDFLFIDDFIALCLALVGRDEHPGCEVFNAGSGVGVSLNELLALVERVTAGELAVERVPARSVDVRSIVLDSSRALEALGWRAETSLEEGLRRAWEWMAAH